VWLVSVDVQLLCTLVLENAAREIKIFERKFVYATLQCPMVRFIGQTHPQLKSQVSGPSMVWNLCAPTIRITATTVFCRMSKHAEAMNYSSRPYPSSQGGKATQNPNFLQQPYLM